MERNSSLIFPILFAAVVVGGFLVLADGSFVALPAPEVPGERPSAGASGSIRQQDESQAPVTVLVSPPVREGITTEAAGRPKRGTVTAYTWTDAEGVTHYGDRPHRLGEADTVTVNTNANILKAVPVEKRAERPKARQSRAPAQTASAGSSDRSAALCRSYKDQLEALETRMRRGYKASESNYLRAKKRNLESRIADHC